MNEYDRDHHIETKPGGRRGFIWIVIAAIVCVALVFGLMFVNGAGPFAVRNEVADFVDGAGLADGEVVPVAWATAGEGYKDLFAMINAQVIGYNDDLRVFNEAAPDAGAPASGASPEAPAPVPASEDAPDAGNAPPGEMATAGSGYEGFEPQFPTDGDGQNADPGVGLEEPGDEDDYSETNEQVAGVREADVLKTDGSYIYAINSNNLWIAEADQGEMSLLSKIAQPIAEEGQIYFEMYVSGDRLIAIRHGYNPAALLRVGGAESDAPPGGAADTCIAYPIGGYITDTSVDIFDISDRAAPVKIHTLSQSGDYNNSRMVGGYLYLLTTYYGGDLARIEEGDPRTFVPLYARDGEQFTPGINDIYLPEDSSSASYTVISGIDAIGSGDFVSQKSVYGDAGTVYVSPSAVYLARTSWEGVQEDAGPAGRRYTGYTNWSETIISKLTIGSGLVEPGAQARVPGYVLNQFSMDEYGGALRLVTTNDRSIWYAYKDMNIMYTDADWARLPAGSSTTTNALYTLDANLNRLGSIEELAPSERVYSCRFMGDIAYFVTFRQTDPLFSVDVSDPAAPKVLGALKIPGFSEYLHPYAEGRLFGLGRDADAETGMQQGLKLTMFDNSNPADVRELHTLVVGDEYSAAEQNHKAILVSADKALIAFPTYDKYLVYGYQDAAGFEKIAEVSFEGGEGAWAEIRGLFIGGTFYVVGPNSINAYSIFDAFAATGSLTVDEGASSVNRWSFATPGTIVPLPFAVEPVATEDAVTDTIE